MKEFIDDLICWIKGHKFEFDQWEIYWKGHRRCQRCGEWEKDAY